MTARIPARILVVDDDAAVVELVAEILAGEGYDVEGVTVPEAALARVEATAFDLVVSDVEMPGMRGTRLLQELRVLRPNLLVVLISVAFALLSGYPLVHVWLAGAAAAAIGLSLSMTITAVRRVRRRILPWALMVLVFVMVAVLRLSLVWVVAIVAPISVALEYARLRREARAR